MPATIFPGEELTAHAAAAAAGGAIIEVTLYDLVDAASAQLVDFQLCGICMRAIHDDDSCLERFDADSPIAMHAFAWSPLVTVGAGVQQSDTRCR